MKDLKNYNLTKEQRNLILLSCLETAKSIKKNNTSIPQSSAEELFYISTSI